MDAHIRAARDDEAEAVGRLTATVYVADGLVHDEDHYVPELRDAASRIADPHGRTLVAELDGRIVGAVHYARHPSTWAEASHDDEAEFRVLVVDPSARGRGVGEALVQAVVELARGAGATALVLSTSPRMATAHRLYERLGFARTPERDWAPQIPLLTYRLDLTAPPPRPVRNAAGRPGPG